MLGQLSRITVGALVSFAAFGVSTAVAADKIKVLIVDGQNNHKWEETTPFMKKVLEDGGRFTVDVATTPTKPKAGEDPAKYREAMAKFKPDFAKYDVVLSNYNGDPWPEETRKALEDYVSKGKALVIVHAANNAFANWGEYNLMIGMGWRDANFGDRLITDEQGKVVRVAKGEGPRSSHGPRHVFPIVVRNADHPITKGMPREWMHAEDELYHGMRGPAQNVTILATAFSDKEKRGTGEHEPMIWTVTYGKGRVFHTPMGHDLTAMRCTGFVTTLLRGTEWAATEKVTIPIPVNFPTEKEVRPIK